MVTFAKSGWYINTCTKNVLYQNCVGRYEVSKPFVVIITKMSEGKIQMHKETDSRQDQLAALDLNFGCHNKEYIKYHLLSLLKASAGQRKKTMF
jgi:hypothetical protein